jgi:hypothetical protein
LLRWLFFLAKAAGPDEKPKLDEIAEATIRLRRNKTDERLRWWLPCFLMAVCVLMLFLVGFDAAAWINLKDNTLVAINGSLFGSVAGLLVCVVRSFFGQPKGPG